MAIDYGKLSDSLAMKPMPGTLVPPGVQVSPWSATGGIQPTGMRPPDWAPTLMPPGQLPKPGPRRPTGPMPGIGPLPPPGDSLPGWQWPQPGQGGGHGWPNFGNMRPFGMGPMGGRNVGGGSGQPALLEQLMALLSGQQTGGGMDVWQQLLQHFMGRGYGG